MSHFEAERACASCGEAFRLADHGVAGAKAVAEALDSNAVSIDDAPDIVRTCPKCLGTERLDATEAHAAMFRLDHAAKRADGGKNLKDTRVLASGTAFLGLALAGGFLFYAIVRGHTLLTTAAIATGAAMALLGIVIGLVAVISANAKRKTVL